jgi:hypothetical protein
LGLAAISASVDHVARVSGALAVADDKLEQIGDVLSAGGPSTTTDAIARSATFGGAPLLDGSYSATLNGHTLAIPSFLSRDLGSEALDQLQKARTDITAFRSNAIDRAAHAAKSSAEDLLGDATPMDLDSAKSAALLVRAKAILEPSAVIGSSSRRAENVLALIR